MNKNIQRLANFSLFAFVALSLAVVYWQVARAGEIVSRPENPRLIDEEMRIQRGTIFDRRGSPLTETAVGEDGYVKRSYLYPELVPVIGFASHRFGPTGVEKAMDDYLAGRKGISAQAMLDTELFHRPVVGNDVVLTVDLDLQKVAERAMAGANGAAVVLNPKTGAILAMVSHPSFDPNQLVFDPNASQWSEEGNRIDAYWRSLTADANAPLLNRATQGLYTPGSTFKTITLAAALERGIAKPDTRYEFEMQPANAQHSTVWHANQFTTCQNHPQDNLDLVHAYAYSCNVVFSDLGLEIGPRVYQDYAKAFGLGTAPPIEIGATASQLFHTPNYFTGDERFYALASTAFGQGEIAATPLQMAMVASAIAADGEIYAPYVVSEVRRKDGTVLEKTTPRVWKRAVQPDTARLVRQIMVTSVEEGWASAAKIQGVKVAGKTGSAESGTSDKPHSWFIGFAPADDPVVAVAVLKEFAGYGSAEAAPAAKTIIEAALQQKGS